MAQAQAQPQEGTTSTNPTMGPAAPMASRCRRFRGGDPMVINAPKVPNRTTGIGMKYGRLVGEPRCRAVR